MFDLTVCLLFALVNIVMVVLCSNDIFLVAGFSFLALMGLFGCIIFND